MQTYPQAGANSFLICRECEAFTFDVRGLTVERVQFSLVGRIDDTDPVENLPESGWQRVGRGVPVWMEVYADNQLVGDCDLS